MDVRNEKTRVRIDPTIPESDRVRIFGCSDCSCLIIHYCNVVEILCPRCNKGIDVFGEYCSMAFADGIAMTLFGEEIRGVIAKVIEEQKRAKSRQV